VLLEYVEDGLDLDSLSRVHAYGRIPRREMNREFDAAAGHLAGRVSFVLTEVC
jgi:hypothetical protein